MIYTATKEDSDAIAISFICAISFLIKNRGSPCPNYKSKTLIFEFCESARHEVPNNNINKIIINNVYPKDSVLLHEIEY